ncbi:hypothetical protein BHM03_00043645 [Ensete ventricosum]|nr:hypothetical protein BHM03_00043645 [Ensete ventricosum]
MVGTTRGADWGEQTAKSCNKQTQPVAGSTYPGGPLPAQGIVNSVLGAMSKPAYLLDITLLSQLRKDAHPSAYSGDHSGVFFGTHLQGSSPEDLLPQPREFYNSIKRAKLHLPVCLHCRLYTQLIAHPEKDCRNTYLGARKYGTGSIGIPGKLQLMLTYTGLLSFKAVDIAVSIISCASS